MNFSIVIVTHNRKQLLMHCLSSIKQSNAQKNFQFEVIIIFNGETSYFSSIQKEYPEHQCFYIPNSTPAHARNYGVSKCQGEYIFFLDDDCYLPINYFENIDFSLGWDALGGPDMTQENANDFERSVGYALSSPFCMGMTYKRHRFSNTKSVRMLADESQLILCNLWFKKDLFSRDKFKFPENLFRSEENFLLKELKRHSKVIIYTDSLRVYHTRKSDLKSLVLSIAKSGECRVDNFLKLPEKKELLYFLPLVFLGFFLYWIFNIFSSVGYFFFFYTVSAGLYVFFYTKQIRPITVLLHYVILISYSLGMLVGLKKQISSTWSRLSSTTTWP